MPLYGNPASNTLLTKIGPNIGKIIFDYRGSSNWVLSVHVDVRVQAYYLKFLAEFLHLLFLMSDFLHHNIESFGPT